MSAPKQLIYPSALHQRLEGILSARLSLLVAGSGFGKTTAVAHYLNYYLPEGYDCHWYTCFDEPPQRSWSGICRLLAYADQTTASRLGRLDVPMPDMLGHVAQLMDALTCDREMVLVIDNYQLANFPAPKRLIESLSLHRSPRLHLVVVTQPIHAEEPLSAFSQSLHLIEQPSFCFMPEDICTLYLQNGIAIPFSTAQQIYEGTGGWIAALMLQLEYTISSGTFDRPGTVILHDLIERGIWRPLNEAQRHFLMFASLLNGFTQSQAAVLMDKQELPVSIRSVIQSNSFIREGDHAYIMHSLLRDYLQEKLSVQPDSLRRLAYVRAGRACLLRRQNLEAVQFLLQAEEFKEAFAVQLTSQEAPYLMREWGGTMAKCLLSLPEDVLTAHLHHLISFGVVAATEGCSPVVSAAVSRLQGLLDAPGTPQGQRDLIRASLELVLSFGDFNNVEAMVAHHRTAWELAGEQIYWLDKETWTFFIPSVVCIYWRKTGTLGADCKSLENGIQYYCGLTGGAGAGAGEAMRAELLLLAGDKNAAVKYADQAIHIAGQHHQDSIVFCAIVTLCRAAVLQGDKATYQAKIDAIRKLAFRGTEYRSLTTMNLCMAFLDYILEQNDDALQWMDGLENVHPYLYSVTVPFTRIIYARKLRQEDPERFLAVAEKFIEEASALHQLLPQIYFYLELAVCHEEQGDRKGAVEALEQALEHALPDSVYLPFAERYAALEKVFDDPDLRCADEQGMSCVRRLGRQFSKGAAVIRTPTDAHAVPLTNREREVALLAKDQLSTKEIAAQLLVSPATVKNTLNKVYSKLNIRRKSDLIHITF